MDPLTALGLLCSAIGAIEGVPPALKQFAAIIQRARQEKRDISPSEIEQLKLDDDEMRAVLDGEIAHAEVAS